MRSRSTGLVFAVLAVFIAAASIAAEPVAVDGPVYFVIYQDVRDETRFEAYVESVMPEIASLGGELVAAGSPNFKEGSLPYRRAVVFRYPSGAVLEQFLASDDYAEIRRLRAGAVDWLAAIIPGLPDTAVAMNDTPAVPADETFDGTWPFKAHYTRAPGFMMHYVDEGTGADTLLLLHGEPTWGYLFRQQIPVWSKQARVIAPDHMGFGKSAAPQDRTYWLQDHIDNLEALVLELDLRNITLVMHDFGGPVGMGVAARHPDRIKQIISVNGPTPFGQPDLVERVTANVAVSPWFQWVFRAEKQGTLDEVLGHLHFNILSTLKLNGFVRNDIVNDTWINAYRAPFPNRAYAAGGIGWARGFATGKHRFEDPEPAAKAAVLNKAALAIWGEQDRTLHAKHFLPLFTQLFPDAPVHRLPQAGHYSLEDAPTEITQLVIDFLNRNAESAASAGHRQ